MASIGGRRAYEILGFLGGGKQQTLCSIICSSDSSHSLGLCLLNLFIRENQKVQFGNEKKQKKRLPPWSCCLINQDWNSFQKQKKENRWRLQQVFIPPSSCLFSVLEGFWNRMKTFYRLCASFGLCKKYLCSCLLKTVVQHNHYVCMRHGNNLSSHSTQLSLMCRVKSFYSESEKLSGWETCGFSTLLPHGHL